MEDSSQVISGSIPDSPQTGNGGEVSAVVSNVRSVKIQIPVAVFTAHRGYDWSKLPDFVSRDEADCLFEKVMSVKTTYCDDLLPYGDAFKGVLYEGKYAFAFRLMTAERWDQAKRDSYYCACAFIPHDMLKDVDFERLLDMDYFKTPIFNPAATLDYVDEDYIPPQNEECYSAVMRLVDGNRDGKWSLIGSVLSMFGDANIQWLFARIIQTGDIKDVSNFGNWDSECLENLRKEMSPNKEITSESISVTGEISQYEDEQSVQPTEGANILSEVVPDYNDQHSQTHENSINCAADDVISVVEANATIEEWDKLCMKLQTQVDNLERELQMVQHQRDDARRSLQYHQVRIKKFETQGNSQGEQINLLHVMLAFLIGVIFSGVIFLAIQLLTSHGGNDVSPKSVSHSAVQSVEALQ